MLQNLWSPKILYRLQNGPPLVPILRHTNSIHIPEPYFLKIWFNVILPPMPNSSKRRLGHWKPPTQQQKLPLLQRPALSNPSGFNHSGAKCRTMKSLTEWFCPHNLPFSDEHIRTLKLKHSSAWKTPCSPLLAHYTTTPCGGGLQYFHRSSCESSEVTTREQSQMRR
jgi:hypothetical protein